MATLKQRLHRKNASGTYDTVHFESSSDLILRPSGRTVEQDLADYLPEVQANDNVPESLLFGTWEPRSKGVLEQIFDSKSPKFFKKSHGFVRVLSKGSEKISLKSLFWNRFIQFCDRCHLKISQFSNYKNLATIEVI